MFEYRDDIDPYEGPDFPLMMDTERQDEIVNLLVDYLTGWDRSVAEIADYSEQQWEDALEAIHMSEYGVTEAMAARVMCQMLRNQIAARVAEAEVEQREEREREDREMLETGADRCPPRE